MEINKCFRDEDLISQWVEERCGTNVRARVPSAQLYKSWTEWADARGFERGTQRSLGEELRVRGYLPYRTGRERGWCSLQLMLARVTDRQAGEP